MTIKYATHALSITKTLELQNVELALPADKVVESMREDSEGEIDLTSVGRDEEIEKSVHFSEEMEKIFDIRILPGFINF